MRTIKFRGKANGRWIYGGLVYSDNIEPAIYFEVGNKVCRMEWAYVDPATVGQFTGLTDRHGCEVYEGDILSITGIKHPRYHIVSWDERKFMFLLGDTPLYVFLRGDTLLREYTVVGNVFDNPELLKGGDV